jgi:hypothetical protein
MNASELIKVLQKLPPDMEVVIRGYEEGYNHLSELIPRKLKPHPEQELDYYGEFIDTGKGDTGGFEAVELFGKNQKAID